MTAIQTTVRLDPEVKEQLGTLSEIVGESRNALVNEALREFLDSRSRKAEAGLEAMLTKLRAYRKTDPGYRKAIAEAAAAEAAIAPEDDPVEGRVVADPHLEAEQAPHSAEATVLKLIDS